MTNQQPTKKEIIEAIKRNNDKKKQKMNINKLNAIRQNSQSGVADFEVPKSSDKKTTHDDSPPSKPTQNNRLIRREQPALDKPLDSRISPLIDSRCRYWVENRISQLLSSDNFTTRSGYSFSIDNDRTNGGLCFRFTNNGTTIVRIDSRGYIYCANVVIGKTSISSLLEQIQNTNINLGLYVKHADLKTGTYELDVKSIVAKDATLKHLLVQPDSENSLEYKTSDSAYSLLLTTSDPAKGMTILCPSMTNNTTIYGFRFGKASSNNNGAQLRFTHVSGSNTANFLGMGVMGTADAFRIYGDRRVYIRTGNSLQQSLVCRYEGNLGNNQYIRMGCGDNRDTGIVAYGRENNENFMYFKLQGRTSTMSLYATRAQLDAGEYFQVNSTKTSGGLTYIIAPNMTAGSFVDFIVGQAKSNNNSATFSYFRQGGAITKPLGALGFFGNATVITYDTDGYTTINTTLTDQDMLNLHTSDTLTNAKYIRQLFSDSTGQAVIDLFHDSQYYGLRLKVPTDNADDNELCIYPTGITMKGAVDIYNDLTLWQKLFVNRIYPASGSTVSVYGNLTLANAANVLTCSNIVKNALASTVSLSPSLVINNSSVNETLLKLATSKALDVNDYIKMVFSSQWQDASISFLSDGLDYFLKLGIDNQLPYLSISTSNVLVNDTLQITGNEEIFSTSSKPLQVYQTTAMSANSEKMIAVGDNTVKACFGLVRDGSSNASACVKMDGGTSSLNISSSLTNLAGDLNMESCKMTSDVKVAGHVHHEFFNSLIPGNYEYGFLFGESNANMKCGYLKYHKHLHDDEKSYIATGMKGGEYVRITKDTIQCYNLRTANKLDAFALGDELKSLIVDLCYPVGSYFMTRTVGFNPNLHFLGTTWVRVNERFLWCSASDTASGGLGAEGGSATHNHNLNPANAHAQIVLHSNGWIRYNDQGSMPQWTANYGVNTGGSGSSSSYGETWATGVFGRTEDTTEWPPWHRVACWYRTA